MCMYFRAGVILQQLNALRVLTRHSQRLLNLTNQ